MSNEVTYTLPPDVDSNATPADAPQRDIDRVREIIFGADSSRQRLQGAEADRLRDILFGTHIEAYERRFSDMQREMEHLATDLRQAQERLNEAEKNHARRIESLTLDLRRMSDDMRRETDRLQNRESHVQQVVSQMQRHNETIVNVAEGVVNLKKAHINYEAEVRTSRAEISDLREQSEQRTQAVRREIRQSEDSVRSELRRIADRLENQKTDRKALASMLIEVATRLETGTNVTSLLEGLHDTKE
jgi:chromosome segregation ATPase